MKLSFASIMVFLLFFPSCGVLNYGEACTIQAPLCFSKLGLWLKADALNLEEGATVSHWADSSGNALDPIQSTGSQMPIFQTSIVNGKPVVRFDGADDHLTLGSQYIYSTFDGLSIIAVVRSNALAFDRDFVVDFGGYATSGYGVQYTSTSVTGYANWSMGGDHTLVTISKTADQFSIVSFDVEFRVKQELYLDGVLLASNPITLGSLEESNIFECPIRGGCTANNGPVVIGGQSKTGLEAGRFLDGDLAELIIYSRHLAPSEREFIENYLRGKYGL